MPISYETLIEGIERTHRSALKSVQSVVEQLYNDARQAYDAVEQYYKIDNLVSVVMSSNVILGNANDFHNTAVVFAREDAYDYACQFLDKGLERNSHSVDLLADYLNYGCQCNRQSECEQYFERLMKLRDRWNWRAYQFSIDYLIELSNYEVKRNDELISELIEAFVQNEPQREEAYLTKAEWIKENSGAFGVTKWPNETFETVLKDVVDGKHPLSRTPKCDLKLADYYYDIGIDFAQTEKLLDRCKNSSVEIQRSVNRTYAYLLSALCSISIFYEIVENGNKRVPEDNSELIEIVQKVYNQYHIAAGDTTDLYVSKCKSLIETFVCETGIAYPYGDEIENRL